MTVGELDTLALERLDDAKALAGAGRFAGAHYICGYAIELKIKARICRMQAWSTYPPASAGADLSRALKTHKLGVLLLLSGMETTMLTTLYPQWSVVLQWDPEQRYEAAPVAAQDAQTMIAATDTLMAVL
jgi:hypothetical protein